MNCPIYEMLPYGRENAVSAATLTTLLELPSERELRHRIARERSVVPILSCENGYFRSKDPSDLHRFIQTMTASATSTLKAVESAQAALDSITGQSRIEGWWE